ncbi:bile acid:sodium symporter family protein [Magnetospirillum molischianum]|uniref:Putative sodium/bile acid symporter family (MazG-like) n=1 Tax=Magnetospirillum molischianum DSM 120 TaxID=1150626 RepID=H8FQY9_MAGML|nr:bile acid:sodium symporter family protein [Magnetospirillum molischianum]CCG40777.1 putative sodium/bile acid symporter family (mazG-like) [Magnetospirillum molischianum DSM 120]
MLSRFRLDSFTLILCGTVVLASVLPGRGTFAAYFHDFSNFAIALLFFLHGARLSREAVFAGATHWRLHLLVLACTFVMFPVLGLAIKAVAPTWLLPEPLAIGVLYLACLPSTVQSSIAFTSIAGGNVPAAICSASASNLIGVLLTPFLVALLITSQDGGGISLDSVEAIMLQLLVPFIAGQLLRPWIGGWVTRHKLLVGLVDRGSILSVVYIAFSEAVVHGLWQQMPLDGLIGMIVIDLVLLAVVLVLTTLFSRWLGFNKADEITIVFCGSKKSLASGVPIANVLFPAAQVGMIVLPIMLFHQIQLMACSALARRYARRFESKEGAASSQS